MEHSKKSAQQSATAWVKPPGARGTAAMDPETRKAVARLGGLKISQDRARMAELGRKGGKSTSKDRAHMAKIGRVGGSSSRGGSSE